MTNEQREQITTMRQGGIGYIKIAQELGLSENTVKSYCRTVISKYFTNEQSQKEIEDTIDKALAMYFENLNTEVVD